MQNACMKQQTAFVYILCMLFIMTNSFCHLNKLDLDLRLKKFRPSYLYPIFWGSETRNTHYYFFVLLKNEVGLHSLKSIMNKKISLLFLFVLSFPV